MGRYKIQTSKPPEEKSYLKTLGFGRRRSSSKNTKLISKLSSSSLTGNPLNQHTQLDDVVQGNVRRGESHSNMSADRPGDVDTHIQNFTHKYDAGGQQGRREIESLRREFWDD